MRLFGMSLLALIALLTAGCGGGGSGDAAPATVTVTVTSSSSPSEVVASETEPAVPQTYHPTKSDFAVRIRVTSKQCFGSAGCIVDYSMSLTWTGPPAAPKLDHAYDITYKVIGDESGPILETVTVQPNKRYSVPDDTSMDTANTSVKPTATIIRVTRAY